jgi:hypothetical protein
MIFDCHINNSAVSFVQRKPHPERILMWPSTVKTSNNLPYLLRLCPKTEKYLDWKTIDYVVKTLVEDMKTEEPKIYTMDSWFDSSSEVKAYLEAKNQYYILGAYIGRNRHLWSVAKDSLLPNSWRHYHNEKTNQMASIFSDEGIHCCLTNAYIPQSTYSTRTLRRNVHFHNITKHISIQYRFI